MDNVLTVRAATQRLRKRYRIDYSGATPRIRVRYKRYNLEDFSKEGFHQLSFTNCGYYAGFRITGFEYGINDYALIEEVK